MRWWRLFIDKLTGRSSELQDVGGPRRRRAIRYDYQVELSAKCESWPEFLALFASDVSRGGLFIPTTEKAKPGERVQVELDLPDGSSLALTGTVVNILGELEANATGREPGLGVELHEPIGEARLRFEELLTRAQQEQPAPAEDEAITKTGSVRLSAVHRAVEDGELPEWGASSVEEKRAEEKAKKKGAEPAREADDDAPPVEERKEPAAAESQKRQEVRRPSSRAREPVPTGPIVGIDLGTTYTSIATVRGKKVTVLPRDDGTRSTPSVVAFPERGRIVVGTEARERIATDPGHTVVSPKRLLGRPFQDVEVQTFFSRAPYRMLEGPDGTPTIEMWRERYAIPQLCSFLLDDVRKLAELHLEEPVKRAVVTVPISFDETRLEALRRAGKMVEIDIVAVIDEPSAAALANRFDPHFGGVVGIYEWGGGTFDFSVVDVSAGDFKVLATSGDTWLGGDDFDLVLAEAAANQFWREHRVDLRRQAVEWQRLVFACERAKRNLTDKDSTLIYVPEALRTAEGMVDLKLSVDRATLRRASQGIIRRSLDTCNEALDLLDLAPSDLQVVYLSGGCTYVPAVREAVSAHFKIPVRTGVPPEHAVCLGAAIHAAQLQLRQAATLAARS